MPARGRGGASPRVRSSSRPEGVPRSDVYATGACIVLNLVVDPLYGIVDPRIKLEQAS